ncbi:hypothetical protein [Bremerella sp.]|uniref:hypothetical protein n=1 Tax=Bremerella sp. TaxID=2795602 RepID=UPI00391D9CC9
MTATGWILIGKSCSNRCWIDSTPNWTCQTTGCWKPNSIPTRCWKIDSTTRSRKIRWSLNSNCCSIRCLNRWTSCSMTNC